MLFLSAVDVAVDVSLEMILPLSGRDD